MDEEIIDSGSSSIFEKTVDIMDKQLEQNLGNPNLELVRCAKQKVQILSFLGQK